eukprot:1160005-Pelagomonas_calceolata.AAC.12
MQAQPLQQQHLHAQQLHLRRSQWALPPLPPHPLAATAALKIPLPIPFQQAAIPIAVPIPISIAVPIAILPEDIRVRHPTDIAEHPPAWQHPIPPPASPHTQSSCSRQQPLLLPPDPPARRARQQARSGRRTAATRPSARAARPAGPGCACSAEQPHVHARYCKQPLPKTRRWSWSNHCLSHPASLSRLQAAPVLLVYQGVGRSEVCGHRGGLALLAGALVACVRRAGVHGVGGMPLHPAQSTPPAPGRARYAARCLRGPVSTATKQSRGKRTDECQ